MLIELAIELTPEEYIRWIRYIENANDGLDPGLKRLTFQNHVKHLILDELGLPGGTHVR